MTSPIGTAARPRAVTDPAQMSRIASALAEAKSRQDVAAALAIYHPDCVLEAPSLGTRNVGADQIRPALEGFFKRFPDYAVTLEGMAADGEVLAAWGSIQLTLSGRPGGQTPNGRRASVPVFILFRFADDQVVWESFNFDLASLCRQSGVSVDAMFAAAA